MVRIIKRKYALIRNPYVRPVERKAILLPPKITPISDPTMIFDSWNQADKRDDDSELMAAILLRNSDLTPTTQEQMTISSLMSKVQHILDNLIMAPGDFTACKVEAACQVGSYKKGTMLRGRNIADIVVILESSPTKETTQAMLRKMQDEMNEIMTTEIVMRSDLITIEANDNGIDVFNCHARVRVLLTTSNTQESNANAEEMQRRLIAIKHIRWFEIQAHHSTMKALIRILRDMVERFDGLKMLSTRVIDLLVHFACSRQSNSEALPIHKAFCRVLKLLATGLFLPGSSGIIDPCDGNHANIADSMTLQETDTCCMTAQTLLRTLLHGGYKFILETAEGIATEGNWDGVRVLPSKRVLDEDESINKEEPIAA